MLGIQSPLENMKDQLSNFGQVQCSQCENRFSLRVFPFESADIPMLADKLASFFVPLRLSYNIAVGKQYITCNWEVRRY